jgi:hypothetical protein
MDFPEMGPGKGANRKSGASGDFQHPHPLLTFADFMDTFTCPDYIVDGIIQRGRLHGLTSVSGHGKTAVGLLLACHIGVGRNIANIEVTQGTVLFLAGENPDDLCGRCWAACQHYGIDPQKMPIRVVPDRFPLDQEAADALKRKIDDLDIPITAIIGDSLAAYFPGDDDNLNVPMGDFARGPLRTLTKCNGNPAVVILCHPVKNASKDNLIPRGGGAFLNELDVNLTLWAEGLRESTTMHWQGKIRGADFTPVSFGLKEITLADKVDRKGRPIKSVVATLMTQEQVEDAHHKINEDSRTVLEHLRRSPGISLAQIAATVGWLTAKQAPDRMKAHRLIKRLADHKLVDKTLDDTVWKITKAGEALLGGKTDSM